MDSLSHPCITTNHLSYSVLWLKLPPPCAVPLVLERACCKPCSSASVAVRSSTGVGVRVGLCVWGCQQCVRLCVCASVSLCACVCQCVCVSLFCVCVSLCMSLCGSAPVLCIQAKSYIFTLAWIFLVIYFLDVFSHIPCGSDFILLHSSFAVSNDKLNMHGTMTCMWLVPRERLSYIWVTMLLYALGPSIV